MHSFLVQSLEEFKHFFEPTHKNEKRYRLELPSLF